VGAFWEGQDDSDVTGSDEQLWSVVLSETGVSTTFFLGQDVKGGQELGVGRDRANLGDNHTSLDVVTLDTSQQDTTVVTSHGGVQFLLEHFDTSDSGLDWGLVVADDFNFVTLLQVTTLNTAGDNGTSTRDGEHVFDTHQERLFQVSLWGWDVGVDGFQQLVDGLGTDFWLTAFQGTEGRTHNDWDVVTIETVGR
ncbi:hypothetical protein WICPIJ_008940, partial [Wickerhamomyces pijperi]